MKTIELSQGFVALVDDEDYESLNQYKWYASLDKKNGTYYAKRNIPLPNGKQTTVRMHVVITGKKGIDHGNRNGLDNQKDNLRPCTGSQNAMNRRKPQRTKPTSSVYKGVHQSFDKWRTQIYVDKKRVYSHTFGSEIEAAQAYDLEAVKHFGEFAVRNFPIQT